MPPVRTPAAGIMRLDGVLDALVETGHLPSRARDLGIPVFHVMHHAGDVRLVELRPWTTKPSCGGRGSGWSTGTALPMTSEDRSAAIRRLDTLGSFACGTSTFDAHTYP